MRPKQRTESRKETVNIIEKALQCPSYPLAKITGPCCAAILNAGEESESCFVEPSTGIPRLGFSTGMRSRRRTVETAIQRIEDNEDIMNVLLAPEEAVKLTPSYDSAITKKIKALPKDFYLLGGRGDMLPHVPVFNQVKGTTWRKRPVR